jgi:hypothetical protein
MAVVVKCASATLCPWLTYPQVPVHLASVLAAPDRGPHARNRLRPPRGRGDDGAVAAARVPAAVPSSRPRSFPM